MVDIIRCVSTWILNLGEETTNKYLDMNPVECWNRRYRPFITGRTHNLFFKTYFLFEFVMFRYYVC